MQVRATLPLRFLEEMSACRIQLRMMSGADLNRALPRRVYVMTIDPAMTRSDAISEEIGDGTLTVAWEFSPLLAAVDLCIHHVSSRTE